MSDESVSVEADSTEMKAPRRPRTTPKWETDAKERLKSHLRKYLKPLADLVARDANEGDTRLFVTDVLCDALGYDKYADLTTEYQVKGEFADYGLRIDKELVAFIETKRAATKLAPKHLRQVEMYAVNEGVEWLILTNGQHWQVYHLTGGLPVSVDLAFEVDLLADGVPLGEKVNHLFYISRESLKRRQMDELWKAKAATAPKRLAEIIVSDGSLTVIRKELKKRTGHAIADAELARLIRNTVIKPELIAE